MSDLSPEQIRHGISLMARSTDRFPVNPGAFRNLATTWRPPLPKQSRQIDDYSTKATAWRACQSAFAMRLCGMTAPNAPHTAFDVQSVVESVYWDDYRRSESIKRGHADNQVFDQQLFESLKRNFEGAWN